MLCVGCILHDKGAPGGGVGVKGGDWYLAIVGCCRAAGAGDYDSSCSSPAQEQPPPHRRSSSSRSLKSMKRKRKGLPLRIYDGNAGELHTIITHFIVTPN